MIFAAEVPVCSYERIGLIGASAEALEGGLRTPQVNSGSSALSVGTESHPVAAHPRCKSDTDVASEQS